MNRYLLSDEQAMDAAKARNAAIEAKRPHTCLMSLQSKDGVTVFVDCGITYDLDGQGRLVRTPGFVGTGVGL